MIKTLSWEEYSDELKVRLDDKTAECDKLKQQLAIAVEALETIENLTGFPCNIPPLEPLNQICKDAKKQIKELDK